MTEVPVDACRSNEQGESLEELEGGERESGAATRCGTGKPIDDAFTSGGTEYYLFDPVAIKNRCLCYFPGTWPRCFFSEYKLASLFGHSWN